MKKNLLLCLVALTLAACNGSPKSKTAAATGTETLASALPVFTIDSLLSQAEQLVGQPVRVTGHVTHTCKHSGRRCFIVNNSREVSIRVEAKGKIGGFNRELIGTAIDVEGILRERRYSPDDIDNLQKAIDEKRVKNDGSEELCNAETANVRRMRAWMTAHGKNYYATYYLDGQDYREVEQ
jgi:ABC-type Zn uptake system ZnuABC Zn-binding protein ZnuA